MELFLSKTGNDMELITQELEKLLCYTMEKDIIEAEDVEAICANQISGKIFDMVELLDAKESKRALDLYYDLLMLKEPAMRILFLVTRHFQILMQLSDMMGGGFDYKSMASKVGVPEFAVRKYAGQARAFQGKRLEQIVRECVQHGEISKPGSGRSACRGVADHFQYGVTAVAVKKITRARKVWQRERDSINIINKFPYNQNRNTGKEQHNCSFRYFSYFLYSSFLYNSLI